MNVVSLGGMLHGEGQVSQGLLLNFSSGQSSGIPVCVEATARAVITAFAIMTAQACVDVHATQAQCVLMVADQSVMVTVTTAATVVATVTVAGVVTCTATAELC